MSAAFHTAEGLSSLRRQIALLEGTTSAAMGLPPGEGATKGGRLSFGIAAVDGVLEGGLPRAGLHEFRAEETRLTGSLSGFATALLACLSEMERKPFLWVVEGEADREGGGLYGPGLLALGLDPARLFVVRVRRPDDALWVFEEGLRCRGLAAVVGEIHGHPRSLDLTASRRLSIRAREEGVMGILLRQGAEAETGAGLTRWAVRSRPSSIEAGFPAGIGRPAWRLDLERNRLGPIASFDLEWDHEHHSFNLARSALSVAGSHPPSHRPASPSPLRPELAFRRTG